MANCGFTIRLDTAKEGIAEKLAGFKAQPDVLVSKAVLDKTGKVVTPAVTKPANQTHIEEVKARIVAKVAALPADCDGVLVIASGQHDEVVGRSFETIQIYGKRNHL